MAKQLQQKRIHPPAPLAQRGRKGLASQQDYRQRTARSYPNRRQVERLGLIRKKRYEERNPQDEERSARYEERIISFGEGKKFFEEGKNFFGEQISRDEEGKNQDVEGKIKGKIETSRNQQAEGIPQKGTPSDFKSAKQYQSAFIFARIASVWAMKSS